jgi:serine/threonine protein phosphatase PrpC
LFFFCLPGCTLTAALVHNNLLTLASLGDSSAYLDTGDEVVKLTRDHNVAINAEETERLRRLGVKMARLHGSLTR